MREKNEEHVNEHENRALLKSIEIGNYCEPYTHVPTNTRTHPTHYIDNYLNNRSNEDILRSCRIKIKNIWICICLCTLIIHFIRKEKFLGRLWNQSRRVGYGK